MKPARLTPHTSSYWSLLVKRNVLSSTLIPRRLLPRLLLDKKMGILQFLPLAQTVRRTDNPSLNVVFFKAFGREDTSPSYGSPGQAIRRSKWLVTKVLHRENVRPRRPLLARYSFPTGLKNVLLGSRQTPLPLTPDGLRPEPRPRKRQLPIRDVSPLLHS